MSDRHKNRKLLSDDLKEIEEKVKEWKNKKETYVDVDYKDEHLSARCKRTSCR